jgi:hypothetical protein
MHCAILATESESVPSQSKITNFGLFVAIVRVGTL